MGRRTLQSTMTLLVAVSLALNTLSLALILGVLILMLWRKWGSGAQQELKLFLLTCAGWIASASLIQTAAALDAPDNFLVPFANVAITAYCLVTMAGFRLIVVAADRMSQALEIVSRMGLVFCVLLQLPLWQGELFPTYPPGLTGVYVQYTRMSAVFAALIVATYQTLTLLLTHRYRRRIGQPALLIGVSLFQGANLSMAVVPELRDLSVSAWIAAPVALLLGYNLVWREYLLPLRAQVGRVRTLRDFALILASPASGDLSARIARSASSLIGVKMAVLFLLNPGSELEVVASTSDEVQIGARLERGQGLAGWVVQRAQPLRVSDYLSWDSRLEGFHALDFCSAMSVPLIYKGRVLGAVTVADQNPDRYFSDEEQALLELLALQAAAALDNCSEH